MKYVMLETPDGGKLPVIFPETLTHKYVALVMCRSADIELKMRGTKVVSAGFVGFGETAVAGESESLGGLQSNPLDAVRIRVGQSVSHVPDAMLEPLAKKLGMSQ